MFLSAPEIEKIDQKWRKFKMEKIDKKIGNIPRLEQIWGKYLDTQTNAKKPRSSEKPSAGNTGLTDNPRNLYYIQVLADNP